jgi:hypothetical protein
MLGWLVGQNIASLPVWDKSQRDDGTLSGAEFAFRALTCGAPCPRAAGRALRTQARRTRGGARLPGVRGCGEARRADPVRSARDRAQTGSCAGDASAGARTEPVRRYEGRLVFELAGPIAVHDSVYRLVALGGLMPLGHGLEIVVKRSPGMA